MRLEGSSAHVVACSLQMAGTAASAVLFYCNGRTVPLRDVMSRLLCILLNSSRNLTRLGPHAMA
jgi:hypothetical protein